MKAFYKMKEIVLNEFGNIWWHDSEIENGWEYDFSVEYEKEDEGKNIGENVKKYFKRISNVINEICNKEVTLIENDIKVKDFGYNRISKCIEFECIVEDKKTKKYEFFSKVIVTFYENTFYIKFIITKKLIDFTIEKDKIEYKVFKKYIEDEFGKDADVCGLKDGYWFWFSWNDYIGLEENKKKYLERTKNVLNKLFMENIKFEENYKEEYCNILKKLEKFYICKFSKKVIKNNKEYLQKVQITIEDNDFRIDVCEDGHSKRKYF